MDFDTKITLDKKTIESPNLCDRFTDDELGRLGAFVKENYDRDLQSREKWLDRTSAALDLAMQVQKDKSFPWAGAANIAFPLITIAALQFHSRAYPALLHGPDIVQCRVIGPDPDGSKSATADKVACYMSWQLMEQDESWEEQMDRALLNVPIVGCAFKKSYYDPGKGHNVSEVVMAKDLVLNYYAKSVDDCPVKTHSFPMSRNTIYSRIMDGTYRDVRDEAWFTGDAQAPQPTAVQADSDNRKGLVQPQSDANTPFSGLEQHLSLDLDGDGYAEPYIVTVEETTQTVLRIVTRFEREQDIERNKRGEVIRIHAEEYFTKIGFIPSPDGGIYDYGFGVLLGPLNESVNSAINQLFDAGTLANTAGGFLGRGAKIRGGVYSFSPFEWNRVDSTGDDLRKSLVPLPVREPSMVLFQLLNLIINYTEKVSGAVDISTGGNPGQNTPAQTSQTMVEQGQKVFAAIFKRIWRSLKQEYAKLYQLNGKYLPDTIHFAGTDTYIARSDFLGDPSAIIPSADPTILSDQQRVGQAQALMQIGKGNPAFDQDELNIRYLKALKIPGIAKLYKGMANVPPPPPDVKIQVEMLKQKMHMANLEWKKLQFVSSLMEQRQLNQAKITELMAQAALLMEQAGGVQEGNKIAAFEAAIGALTSVNDSITNQVQAQQANQGESDVGSNAPNQSGNAGNGATGLLGMASPSGNGPVLPMGAGQA